MIITSKEYKEYIAGERVFSGGATITLFDSTILSVGNDDIMSGGIKIDDSSSEDGVFTIGSAIINQLTLILNNDNGQFDTYDFTNTIIRPKVGLELSTTIEWLNKGVFTVDEAKAVGSTIVLTALDNMNKFDASFSYVSITFPCTAKFLLQAVCTHCGVELASTTFLNSDYVITTRPSDEVITCREVISWIAQMSGSFARCNTNGALELKWYDFGVFSNDLDGGTFDSDTPYSSGDDADGGDFTFSESTTYDGGTFEDMGRYHHIYSMQSATISTDDIVITGIQAIVTETGESFLYGTDEYVLTIENPLIKSGDAELIATTVGQKIVGMRFRPLSVSALSDPSIEAGDVAWVSDRKGNSYPTVITNLSYSIGSFENISCEAETVSKKQSVQYTPQEKAVAEIKEIVEKESTARQEAIAELNETISQSGGLFYTVETLPNGSKINYLHDKPTLVASNIVWKMTAEAMAVSTNGGMTYTAGITADGNAIVNRLNAQTVTGVTINGSAINGGVFKTTGPDSDIKIENGQIYATFGDPYSGEDWSETLFTSGDILMYRVTGGVGNETRIGTSGISTTGKMECTALSCSALNGLNESSNGNPFLNGKAVGTTSWVLANFAKSSWVTDNYPETSWVTGNFARLSHSHTTAEIAWIDNGNTNVSFNGGTAASTSWVLANFARSTSDERLKDIVGDIDNVTKLYLSFEGKEWIPKEKTNYRKKKHTTLTAQGVMKAFEDNGLDWKEYDIIEEKEVSDTDFCGDISEYVDGEKYYVINDKNLHAYHIAFGQEFYREYTEEIESLKNELSELKLLLTEKGVM